MADPVALNPVAHVKVHAVLYGSGPVQSVVPSAFLIMAELSTFPIAGQMISAIEKGIK